MVTRDPLLPYDKLMSYWTYREYDDTDVKKLLDFMEKPPATFKLNDTFQNNLTLLVKTFGVVVHPDVIKQSTIKKPFFEVRV